MRDQQHPSINGVHTRRDAVRYGVAGGLALTAIGGLTACGGSTSTGTGTAAGAGGTPTKGGVLRVGLATGGSTETLDPWGAFAQNDYARVINLYDTLFVYDDDLGIQPALAESAEASKNGKTWTLKLRKGVTFHDGSAFTADDVLYNVAEWVKPDALFNQQVGHQIDPKKVKKIDDHTVRIGLLAANGAFNEDLAFLWGSIKSRNEKKGGPPIGTGPFKYKSFKAGSRSEFAAFPGYWNTAPFVDALIMDTSFTDEAARVNALRSNAIDVLPAVPFAQAATLKSGATKLLRAQSGNFQNLYMRLDAAPFDDVRVRQAMRLLVDRQNMVDVVYAGNGKVSNDVPGRFTKDYDESLTRERDVEQARSLLKQAGKQNLAVTLRTSTALTGLTDAATLFKQQAQDAGVRVTLQRVDPAAYFDPATNYGKMAFAQTAYFPVPSLNFVWSSSFETRGPTNETHTYGAPFYDKLRSLLAEARASTDAARRTELWKELQKQQFDAGGYINWGTYDNLDALNAKVQGLTPSKYLNCSGYNFRKAWISA